jgi:paraquat-inducible protein B
MPDSYDADKIPQAIIEPKKGMKISIVWIIPVVAAIIAIGIAVQRILTEGPTITIVFKVAEGLEAGKTSVKYKNVNIGLVKKVELTRDFSKVEVTVKIDKSAEGLIVEDAKFWIVQPRVTMGGISGLGTLLSGNYIGFEAGKSVKPQRKFIGLEMPPIVTSDRPGREFLLKATDIGSLGIGSPIYYRHLKAGEVIAYNMAGDGNTVDIKVFIDAPYDQYVEPETRFWNASGVDVSVGATGFEVRTQSVISLLAGGVAFDMPPFAVKTQPAAADTVFTLYSDQSAAMKKPEFIGAHYVLYFPETLRGLSAGAPVTFLGLPAGEVTDVGLDFDPKTSNVRGRVDIVTYPERLISHLHREQAAAGKTIVHSQQERLALMRKLVEDKGLRAQLRSGSLITGQLYVALEFFPNAPKARVDWNADPVALPVTPSGLTDVEQKVTAILAKLDKLPLEAIGEDVRKLLASLDQMTADANKALNRIDSEITPGLKTTMEDLSRTLVTAEGVLKNTNETLVGKDAPSQQELRNALHEIAGAARSLRILTEFLDRHPEALIHGKSEEKP